MMKEEVKVKCDMCKIDHVIKVNPEDYKEWKDGGRHIQHVMPYLTPSERELLISKTCGECFEVLFGKEEE